MAGRSRFSLLAELVAGIGAAALILIAAGPFGPRLPQSLKTWIVPVFLLYAPILAALLAGRDFNGPGLVPPRWKTAALDLALLAAVVLPVFLLGWFLFARHALGYGFVLRWPKDPLGLVLWQFLGVALPEEVFFRGWLQGRLNQLMPPSHKLAGARVGPGLFIAAALFALAHLAATPGPVHLLVFFPGMMFGFFRERSRSVALPAVAHGLSNVVFLAAQGMAR